MRNIGKVGRLEIPYQQRPNFYNFQRMKKIYQKAYIFSFLLLIPKNNKNVLQRRQSISKTRKNITIFVEMGQILPFREVTEQILSPYLLTRVTLVI